VPGLAVYAATKAAVLNFSLSLQGDLDAERIPVRVHALCPDVADTALVRGEQGHRDSAILFAQPVLLTPGQVADAALEMLDGRRLVRSLPVRRGVLARTGSVVPSVALRVLDRMRAQGERRRVRS
jgi:short-subunit dehydrogenase